MKIVKIIALCLATGAIISAFVIIPKLMQPTKTCERTMQYTFMINGKAYTREYPVIKFEFTKTEGVITADDTENLTALVDLNELPPEIREDLVKQYNPTSQYLAVTKDGSVITDVGTQEVPATCTPGYILWENCIGTMWHPMQPHEKGLCGGGRRTDFCKGACVYRMKEATE